MKRSILHTIFWCFFGVVVGALLMYVITHNSHTRLHGNDWTQTIRIIEDEYVDEVDVTTLYNKVLPELVQKLDPHSVFIPQEDVKRDSERLEGTFDGIGIQFNRLKDTVIIDKVVPDGPSERAGLLVGDRLLAADNSLLYGDSTTNESVFNKLRGPSGSIVNLLVRGYNGKERQVKVVRGAIPLKSIEVAYLHNDNIGIIYINSWGRTTYHEFLESAVRLRKEGAKALVIDLRDNGGGYMQPAIQVANEFLKGKQLIVYAEGRSFERQDFYSDGSGFFQDMPLAVLVDEGSASASEIFTGAMQDHDRAYIVGRRTFGKGLVQKPFTLESGGELRLTVARYYTPSGRCIQKKYTLGDSQQYNSEVWHRYESGEFLSPDSLKMLDSTEYFTDAGRVVYGGYGIMPDHFVSIDQSEPSNAYYLRLLKSGTLPWYAFEFVDKRRKELSYIKSVEGLLVYLEERPYILYEYAGFAAKHGVPQRSAMLYEVSDVLMHQIIAHIARQVYHLEGAYKVASERDEVLFEASQLLNKDLLQDEGN